MRGVFFDSFSSIKKLFRNQKFRNLIINLIIPRNLIIPGSYMC